MSLINRVAVGAAGSMLLLMLVVTAAVSAVVSVFASPLDDLWRSIDGGHAHVSAPHPDAAGEIPAGMYALYREAATGCPGLSWSVLAGIGKVESDHGRSRTQISDAGAVGPMQMLPTTFNAYALPVPSGGAVPPSPWDPVDAVYAAARMLCRNGAAARDLHAAVFAYNHDRSYVERVLELSDVYVAASPSDGLLAEAARLAPSRAARIAIDYAAAQIGRPYIWGGDGPDRTGEAGFDCSGLTQSAYQAAGVKIPRTATAQFTSGHKVNRASLLPGDLVFYGNPRGFLHHVAIYVGSGYVVDAPRPGKKVRLDPLGASDYAGAVREN